MRNIFLEKSYRECGGETTPDPFLKSKLNISPNQQCETSYSLFLLYLQV